MDQEQQDNETETASRVGMELLQPTPHGEIRSRANTMYLKLKRHLPECAILAVDCLSLLREVGESAVAETEFKCRIIELEAENARWKKAIEGLTPNGSEFVNDPEACAAYIRDRQNYPKQILDLRAENAALTERSSNLFRLLGQRTDELSALRAARAPSEQRKADLSLLGSSVAWWSKGCINRINQAEIDALARVLAEDETKGD